MNPCADLERLVGRPFDVGGHDPLLVFAAALGVEPGVEAGVAPVGAHRPPTAPPRSLTFTRRSVPLTGVDAHQPNSTYILDTCALVPLAPMPGTRKFLKVDEPGAAALRHELPGGVDDVLPPLTGP